MSFDGWGPTAEDGSAAAARRERDSRQMDRQRWWALNRSLRFYGIVLLVGTKTADAVTTAIGLRYVPGIVELNPFASGVFAGHGLYAGLATMSVATVVVTVVLAELLAVQVRLRLRMNRLALVTKAAIYAALSGWFGLVAVANALLISEQVQGHLLELLAVVA